MKMKNTLTIKEYTCSRTLQSNGTATYHCTCPAWEMALTRGVPCKHILSILFTGCDVSKWENIRSTFAKQFSMNNSKAEMILGKGLRYNEPAVMEWYVEYQRSQIKNIPKEFSLGEI
jgi:hypothetical protein